HQPEATPVLGSRRVFAEFGLLMAPSLLEHRPRRQHLTLRRGPGADARTQRPAAVISVGLGSGHPLNPPFDPDHALEFRPKKLDGRMRVGGQLASLAAVVVG